jgi:ubiquinone/menaquinone biosynthesis C-methylase UbiE
MDLGFENLVGTEISDVYIGICKLRFKEKVSIRRVTGEAMPFDAESFGAVFSAHIVEHTKNPRAYILECLRCLAPEGLLYLEFPSRYNKVELHTGTFSVEWLPLPLRYLALRILQLFAPNRKNRELYRSVVETLRPISVGMVLRFSRSAGYKVRVECNQRIGGIQRLTLRVIGENP